MSDPHPLPSDEGLDAERMAWVEGEIGPFEILSRFAHSHGYSRLWRLAAGGERVWLKMHAYPNKWAGEVHALARWTPAIGRAPRLIAHRSEPEAVLLSEVPGVAAESLTLDPAAEERMWREAGAWLAALHARENGWIGGVRADGSPERDGTPECDAEAFHRRDWETKFARGKASGLFDAVELDFAAGTVRAGLSALAGERPRAIHRDFTPRNWTATREGELTAVIDFEHARWDVRVADLDRPWDGDFRRNPRLIDAFYEAYGPLDERRREQLRTFRVIKAFTTVVWAIGVNDLPFAQHGRDSLHRLMVAESARRGE